MNNTIIMNQDIHQPAFIKADASYKTEKNRQPPSSPKQVRRFGWTRFIELAVLLSIVIGAVYLISKIVTLAVLACRHLGNPALCALSAQGTIFFDLFFFMSGYLA